MIDTISYTDLLAQAITHARAESKTLADVMTAAAAAWTHVDGDTPAWDANGMSMPASTGELAGLVRFRDLETLRAQYEANGQHGAAKSIRTWYACTPAAHLVEPNSMGAAVIAVSTSTAGFRYGIGLINWWDVHRMTESHTTIGGPQFVNTPEIIPDAWACPQTWTTAERVIAEIRTIAKRFVGT